jgi:hypothetical protein
MLPVFHAACVTVENNEDCVLVGFADRQFDTTCYLMFQRAHEFGEQDHRTGMAAVYVERDDQRWSGYGGMQRCELLRDRIRLHFDESGAAKMEGIRTMEVSFEITPHQMEGLREGLRQCFSGFEYYVDGAA